MKKRLLAVIPILLIAGGLYLLYTSRPPAESVTTSPSAQTGKTNAPIPPPASPLPSASALTVSQPTLADRAGQVIQDTYPPPALPPETVLQNVEHSVRQYGRMFGGNPVGTNPEITSQLAGKNPRHINFIDAQAGMRVDSNGELIDAWGTPYFFHQLSGTEMEIHSAGPDKIMWTADDLVVK